jgi:hypothetical protein
MPCGRPERAGNPREQDEEQRQRKLLGPGQAVGIQDVEHEPAREQRTCESEPEEKHAPIERRATQLLVLHVSRAHR